MRPRGCTAFEQAPLCPGRRGAARHVPSTVSTDTHGCQALPEEPGVHGCKPTGPASQSVLLRDGETVNLTERDRTGGSWIVDGPQTDDG